MARLKKGEEKKEQITFRLKSDTVAKLKNINKYHSKIDKYINLGIDFENILNLSREDIFENINRLTIELCNFDKLDKNKICVEKDRFHFYKTDDYLKEMLSRYDDETIKNLRAFYYLAFIDNNILEIFSDQRVTRMDRVKRDD